MRIIIMLSLFLLIPSITIYGQTTPKEAERLQQQGDMAFNSKAYTQALSFYRQALQSNPNYKEAKMAMGNTFYTIKNYTKALRYFKDAEAQYQNDYKIKIRLAKVRIQQKRYDSAESYLVRAIDLHPKDIDIYLSYGDLYFSRMNYEKAIQQYEQALRIKKNNQQALHRIGKSFLMLKKPEKALEKLQKAEDEDNKNPATNYYLGEYYYKQGDYESSEEYLNTALLIEPTHVPSMNILFQVLYEIEKYEPTKDILEKLVAMYPKNKKYYYHLGLAYEKLGRAEDSLNILIDGINLDLSDEALRFQAERTYHKYYWSNTEVRERGAVLADYWYKTGKNYLEQKLPTYAIFCFRRGVRLDPNHWQMRFELAKIYKSRKLTNIYYNELKIIKELNPNNQEIDDELMFSERAMKRILSRREGIEQYNEPKTRPTIALLFFKKNRDFNQHYGIEEMYREILYTTLKMKHHLNILLIEESKNFKSPEEIAREANADFVLTGEVMELNREIQIKLRVSNLIDGELYESIQCSQRGNQRFLSSAMYLSNRVSEIFPVIGKIIRLNYQDAFINLGKRHGFKKGQIFYVIPTEDTLTKLLVKSNLVDIFSQKELLNKSLLAHVQNAKFGVEEMRITEIDENIAKAKLITSNFFDEVNINDYVIPKP